MEHPRAVRNNFNTTLGCVRTPGERLAYFRKSAKLNLGQLAEMTGISRSELSRLENGGRILKPEHCIVLSQAYGITQMDFEDALRFDPLSLIAAQPEQAAEPVVFERRRTIPCYSAAAYPERGSGAPTITLTVDVPLSPDAYAIRIDINDAYLPVDGLVLADPAARTVLGDLVVNAVDRRSLLISLHRDSDGMLAGRTGSSTIVFPRQVSVTSFHKVVAMFPAPHLVA